MKYFISALVIAFSMTEAFAVVVKPSAPKPPKAASVPVIPRLGMSDYSGDKCSRYFIADECRKTK